MKNSKLISIICIFLVISSVIIVCRGVALGADEAQVGEAMYGWGYLKAFTVDSNILMAVAALILLISMCKKELPKWVVRLQLAASTSVMLTFVVVVVFLAPMMMLAGRGYFFMFRNEMFFFHFLNPLLGFVMVAFLLETYEYSHRDCWLAILPTVAYSIVYASCVLIFKCWSDFYNFTFGGRLYLAPLSTLALYMASYGLARLTRRIHNRRLG